MADAREWYEVDALTTEFPNLESAIEAAREKLGRGGPGIVYEIHRVERTPVRCLKREVSITETDLTIPPPA